MLCYIILHHTIIIIHYYDIYIYICIHNILLYYLTIYQTTSYYIMLCYVIGSQCLSACSDPPRFARSTVRARNQSGPQLSIIL